MFQDQYKADQEKIQPTKESLYALNFKMRRELGRRNEKNYSKWVKAASAVAALVILFAVCFQIFRLPAVSQPAASGAGNESNGLVSTPKEPQDYGDVYQKLATVRREQENTQREKALYAGGGLDGLVNGAPAASSATATAENAAADTGSGHSETNIQVAGVEEADCIKTDGEYIYAVARDDIYILKANGGDPQILSKLTRSHNTKNAEERLVKDEYVSELYIAENRLILMKYVTEYTDYEAYAEGEEINSYYNQSRTAVEIYDTSDKSNPVFLNELGQSGDSLSSRMVGNVLYLISNQVIYDEPDEATPETYVPSLYNGEKCFAMPADDIYLLPHPTGAQYLVVGSVDVQNPQDFLSSQSILGCGSTIYATPESLYIAAQMSDVNGDTVTGRTDLFKFSMQAGAVAFEAQGSVPGTVLNQFSMDEYNGYFRLVTTQSTTEYNNGIMPRMYIGAEREDNSVNHLFVLDGSLNTVGSLENLAQGERIYSARFDGGTGYFVTFRQVDPLFTVDLSDPAAPAVMSELKIPGFSNYLHPFGDGLLFGLGMEADEESGKTQGLKLSMFDVSDPYDVTEKSYAYLGDRFHWSDAQYDHKALLVDQEKSMIGFCAENVYLIYTYSPEGGFERLAELSLEADGPHDYDYGIRAVTIGDILYLYTPRGMAAFSMSGGFSRISTQIWYDDEDYGVAVCE